MASGSLFETEDRSGRGKVFIIALIAFVVFAAVGFGVYRYTRPVPPDPSVRIAAEIREAYLFLLAQPSFSGDEFREQLLGKGRVTSYAWQRKEVYFTYPETSEEDFQEFLAKHIIDAAKINFGSQGEGKITLDNYTLTITPDAARFFKTAPSNIRLDTDATLNFPYLSVSYTLSPAEIRDFSNNSQIYGGSLVTRSPESSHEPQFFFANHGIMVAKPGEPSLMRLVEELLRDVGDSREARIQRLLDFVSHEIEYSYTEAVAPREKLKRPNETLMTRSGDCSNKTILLASLLEQINEEYLMLYSPRHITIAVPQGDFVNENKLDFKWDQRQWLIAESTAAGFYIGLSRISDQGLLTKIQYVQNPKIRDLIYDAHSYEELRFY
ncbi:MAG TPA: hypothetical protein PKD24_03595 [Pyrinomonadaceae bacterium]|nr:hypothetical protein [Pyrinomonadaceae bacterium]HMP64635.1 hypothetical protein [Pyrinomonadaceae bacterium]